MKSIQILFLSLILLFAGAARADAAAMSIQGFTCDFSDPGGGTAEFENYQGSLQLYLSVKENSYDQVGAIFGNVTAIPSTVAFDITPVTNISDDVIAIIVYYKYNGTLYSSNYLDPKVVKKGSTYTYTFSSAGANPPIPKGSTIVESMLEFYQASPSAASAYFNNFTINKTAIGKKIMKDAACPW
jgi:hypothetical protein